MKKAEEILRKYIPLPKNEGEKNDDLFIVRAMQEYADQFRQAAVSGSLPLPELVKELGECLEQSSVLIDLGASKTRDDDKVPEHLQRVREARLLYKHYKESGGNDR